MLCQWECHQIPQQNRERGGTGQSVEDKQAGYDHRGNGQMAAGYNSNIDNQEYYEVEEKNDRFDEYQVNQGHQQNGKNEYCDTDEDTADLWQDDVPTDDHHALQQTAL